MVRRACLFFLFFILILILADPVRNAIIKYRSTSGPVTITTLETKPKECCPVAVSIVGSESPVVVSGAGNANVPVPSSTTNGDDHFIVARLRQTAGSAGSATTPSGYSLVAQTGSTYVYWKRYTAAPTGDIPLTFGTTDVHAIIESLTLRGIQLTPTANTPWGSLSALSDSNASHPFVVSSFAVEYDGTFVLSIFGTNGANMTLPAEQNQLYNYAYSGPPAIDLAIGHRTITTHGSVANQQLVHDSTVVDFIQITFVPAGSAESIYLNHWTDTGITTDDPDYAAEIIFDTQGPYAYLVYEEDANGYAAIKKINRNTLAVVASQIFTGYEIQYGNPTEQDNSYIYIGLQNPEVSFIKVAKSTLTVEYATATPSGASLGAFPLHMGKAGTWSQNILFTIGYFGVVDPAPSAYHIVGWNIGDGSLAYNKAIPGAAFSAGNPETPALWYGFSSFSIDDQGDIWVLGAWADNLQFGGDRGFLVKMVNGEFTLFFQRFDNLWHEDAEDLSSMLFDSASNSLFITESNGHFSRNDSRIARYSTVSGLVYANDYGSQTVLAAESAGIQGNGIRSLFGVRSVFTGWGLLNTNFSGGNGSPGNLVQHNFLTGAVVRAIQTPGDYESAKNPVLSPEGKVWMVAYSPTLGGPSFVDHLLILDITTALSEAGEGDGGGEDGQGDGGLRITQQAVEVLHNLPYEITIDRTGSGDDGGLRFLPAQRLRIGGNPNAERWLRLRNKKLIYLVTLTIKYVDGDTVNTENIYLSNHALNTRSDEDPPNIEFIAVLRDEDIPSLKQELSEVLYGLSTPTVGKIVINNADGQFDAKLPISGYVWDGGDVEIKLTGDRTELALEDAILIFTGRIGKITYADNAITVEVMSRAADLQRKKVPNTSFKGVNDEDVLEPVAYGYLYNITPYLKDAVDFTYSIAGHEIEDILDVYDNGVALSGGQYTKDLANGEFTLVAVPAGLITCDVAGKKINGLFSAIRADFIYDLLTTYGGLTDEEVDIDTIDFFAIEVGGDSGIYITNETPVLDACLALLRPVLGFLYFARDGVARVGRFEPPNDDSVISLTLRPSEMFPQGDTEADVSAAGDILVVDQSDILISKAVLLYNRNWTVFTEEQMGAASPIDPNTTAGQIKRDYLKKEALRAEIELTGPTVGRSLYANAEDMEPLDSFFINEGDARAAAQLWLDTYGIARFTISVRCATLAYNASLHNVVELDYSILDEDTGSVKPRWFSSKLTRSVAYQENYGDNVIEMLLFI